MLTRPLSGSGEGISALAKGNEMIEGVGKTGPGRIGAARGSVEATSATTSTGGATTRGGGAVQSSIMSLVAEGPPIDEAKVAEIRAAIADGCYPVDADKIAERMIALDLPRREA